MPSQCHENMKKRYFVSKMSKKIQFWIKWKSEVNGIAHGNISILLLSLLAVF